jgi:hypothetical protein
MDVQIGIERHAPILPIKTAMKRRAANPARQSRRPRPRGHFIPWEIPDEWVDDLRRTCTDAVDLCSIIPSCAERGV